MGMIDEEFKCQEDEDCPSMQYCYKISKRCVNYTMCNRYHRVESQVPARQPSQCGPCMEGYSTEILAIGTDAPYCKKNSDQTNPVSGLDSGVIISIIVVLLIVLFAIILLGYILYKKLISFKKQEPKTYKVENVQCNNAYNKSTAPSAPPKEKSPFIDKIEYHDVPHNNNKILTYDDKHQATRAFFPPDWVSNANYGTNQLDYDSDELTITPDMDDEHAVQHLVHNDNSNNHSQPSEQLAIEMLEHNTQYEDNARNIASQAYPSNHNGSNTDNNSDYTPSLNENENRRNKKRNVYINQSVNQNITMNVRLVNED